MKEFNNMKLPWIILLLLFLYCIRCDEPNSSALELVHVFFRHGSRTPDKHEMYPNDPHAVHGFYPIGYGQLTNDGKQRAYQLGKLLRKRYKIFLGETYTPEIVHSQTTDFDRTKMSALLALAALFQPSPTQKWDESLSWMPIPYQYDKASNDFELRRPNAYCPAYIRELEQVLASDIVKKILKEHTSTFEYITEHTGQRVDKLNDIFKIYQVLHSEENMNLTLPKWTDNVYPDSIRYLAAQQCFFENYSPVLKRLNGGRMLKKVVNNMVQKSQHLLVPPGRKIYLYSGHDNNVINILSTLNLYKPHFPNYSAAVLIELHRVHASNEHFVKVLYVKDVNAEPEERTLPKCGDFCPLDRFLQIVEPHLPVNFTRECESTVSLD